MPDDKKEPNGSLTAGVIGGTAAGGTMGAWQYSVAKKDAAQVAGQPVTKEILDKLAPKSQVVRDAMELNRHLKEGKSAVEKATYAQYTKIDPSNANSKWKEEWISPTGEEVTGGAQDGMKLGKAAQREISWDHLPSQVRSKAVIDGTQSTVKITGEELSQVRQQVLDTHFHPKIQEANSLLQEAVAAETKLGLSVSHAIPGIAVKAGVAGLVVGGLAYFAFKPKSWAKKIEDERTSQQTTPSLPNS